MKQNSSMQGMTLIEILLASTFFVVLITAVFSVLISSQKAINITAVQISMDEQARMILERMVQEIRDGHQDLSELPAENEIRDNIIIQTMFFDGNEKVIKTGPKVRYELRNDIEGDTTDGIDNNGNGLIDEKVLVRIHNPGDPNEVVTVISNKVKKLEFTRELPAKIKITLKLMAKDPENRQIIHESLVQTSVFLRTTN